jgi:hypothetical protein
MTLRRLAFGVAAASAYVTVVVAGVGPVPVRPLYDGLAPPVPYRYVTPPDEFKDSNEPPLPARQEVELTDLGSAAASIATDDGQAAIVLREGSIAPKPGERRALVEITPLDPERVGPPPDGLQYDGNAYRYRVTYASSGTEAALATPVTVVLRFPAFATGLFRRDRNRWADMQATPVAASLQVFADTPRLGMFVAAGPHTKSNRALLIGIASGVAALTAIAAALLARRARDQKRRRRSRRPPKRSRR